MRLGLRLLQSTGGLVLAGVLLWSACVEKSTSSYNSFAPVLDAVGPQSVVEGEVLQFWIHATDPQGDSLILSASNLPANASLVDSGNGAGYFTFQANLNQAGNYQVLISASDGVNVSSQSVEITVLDADKYSITNYVAAPGDTGIIVDINLHNVEPIAGAQLRIVYDSTRLMLSDTPYLKPGRADQMDNYILGSNPDPGEITFAMFPNIGQIGVIAAGDGPILQLLFDVKPTATSGNSQLKFESEGYSINALSDTLGTLIIPQLENGTFTVQ